MKTVDSVFFWLLKSNAKKKKKPGCLNQFLVVKKGPQMWLTPGQACCIANDYDLIDCVCFAIRGKIFLLG